MLSILIPIYNYNVVALVKALHQQAAESQVDFEIIVMEDGSTQYTEVNAQIADISNCSYIPLKENVGRSVIRNKLAEEAKYDHLIFMDCDAEVRSKQYIRNYLPYCNTGSVVIGGTAYDEAIHDSDFSLRLKYGRCREAKTAQQRSEYKYKNFATFNFMIPKSVFNQIRFDESIREYGHEDSVFGYCLTKEGADIIHIDNPLIHKGLDDNTTYIKKTEEAAKNLFIRAKV